MLAAGTLKQHRNFTKSGERSQHDRTNFIQCNWTGYSVAGQQSAAETSRNGNQKEKDELCAIDYAAVLVV